MSETSHDRKRPRPDEGEARAPEESEKRRRAANGEGPDLDSLPPQEREQAIKMMEIARRAEERAARRRQEREANGSKSSPNGQGKQPRSLNDLVKDKKKQDKKLNQVKFVPKAERKKLREQQEREAREQARQEAEENERRRREYRRRLERELKEQEELDRREKAKKREEEAAEAAAERQAGSRGGRGRGGGSGPSRGTGGRGPAADKDPAALSDEAARQKEVEAIKQQHLGGKKRSTKVVKPSEKFSRIFQFDWDSKEDTSVDYNPLYAKRKEATLLFGRGYRAGIDMRQQREASQFMRKLMGKRQELERELAAAGEMSERERRTKEEERERVMRQIRETQRQRQEREDRHIVREGKHWSEKSLDEMTERDWRIFREDFDIRIKGGRAARPLRSWSESSVIPQVMKAIEELGYDKPTPIQRQAIPVGQKRRDVIGIAETGSGKTAAFVIPMIEYILGVPRSMRDRAGEEGPLSLVMAPTRELAQQIEEEALRLSKYTDIRVVAVVGGHSVEEQGLRISRGVDIVIGTPGRLMATLQSTHLVLNQCNWIVLDEADRMIDMGFEHSVTSIMDAMGSLLKSEAEDEAEHNAEQAASGRKFFRTTTMFSATMPPSVERLAQNYLRHPVVVHIGDEESSRNKRITQTVMMVKESAKLRTLSDVVRRATPPIILFVNFKRNCDMVARHLEREGFSATVFHGGKSQELREGALTGFKDGDYDVLVATDVAGRGLDIPDVQHVINFDMASSIDRYCHRIGRTGRAGKAGASTTFITDDDSDTFFDLKNYLESTGANVPPELARHKASSAKPGEQVLSKSDLRQMGM